MSQSISESQPQSASRRGVVIWLVQMIRGLLAYGTLLFLAAGRIDWLEGWVYLGMNAIAQGICAAVLISRNPDLLAERTRVREGTKPWDRFLSVGVALVAPFAIIITAGLDARFGWTASINRFAWIFSLILAFGCQMFVVWAMVSNPYFSLTVRIQSDRGHKPVSRGPYSFVRHPGYFGSVLFSLLCPLVLGSIWTMLPALLSCILTIARTGLEDSTLKAELPGYAEYAAAVRWRLFPGIW